VLQKEDTDWVKKCMEYEVEGSRPRGRPKRTWKEVVQKDCQARNLNKEDAMDRGRWKKPIKIGDDSEVLSSFAHCCLCVGSSQDAHIRVWILA